MYYTNLNLTIYMLWSQKITCNDLQTLGNNNNIKFKVLKYNNKNSFITLKYVNLTLWEKHANNNV